jgi:hypothetical protein
MCVLANMNAMSILKKLNTTKGVRLAFGSNVLAHTPGPAE